MKNASAKSSANCSDAERSDRGGTIGVRRGKPPAPRTRFAQRVSAWQRRHGRHDLPWQRTRDPYRIWLSEIMLQQTQVAAVIPYYKRFLERFPTLQALAAAAPDDVLRHWSGLGYYARARNLQRAAQIIVAEHGGRFPRERAQVEALPGIGRSTAAAIVAFAYGERAAILDGNVRRVIARQFGIAGWPGEPQVSRALWHRAEAELPRRGIAAYTQGLMDLGALVCTRKPLCKVCPVAAGCVARIDGRSAEIPAARPRKRVPRRRAAMLVVLHADRVLLERRPAHGIWGGLWSLPEFALETARSNERGAWRAIVGAAAVPEPLAPIAHAFTHYRLTIEPRLVRLRRPPRDIGARFWLPLNELATAALPAPVRRLLAALPKPAPRTS